MAKNLIPEIARMLGVELGEEFKVVYKVGFEIICNFTKEGVFVYEEGCSGKHDKELLIDIICGKAEIVKLPWKPKAGEMYWTFGLYSLQDPLWVVTSARWRNSPSDMALLEHGWVFNSRKAAEDMLPSAAQARGFRYYTTSGATGKIKGTS